MIFSVDVILLSSAYFLIAEDKRTIKDFKPTFIESYRNKNVKSFR